MVKDKPMTIQIKLGRPSVYDPSMVKVAEDYLTECVGKNETPFIEEFALRIGVSDRTVRNWRDEKDKEELSEVLDKIQDYQKLDLKRKALKGLYISKVATLLLSAEHNVVPIFRKELTGAGGSPIVVESHLNPDQEKKISEGITKLFEDVNK